MESFSQKLFELGNEAFKTAKERLEKLGGSYEFKEGSEPSIYLDPCGDTPELYSINAHKVVLDYDSGYPLLIILGEGCDSVDDVDWDEPFANAWCEGGCIYAEWEGLFEVIDSIPE